MADEKVKLKPADNLTGVQTVIGVVLLAVIVGAIVERIYSSFTSGNLTFYGISVSDAWQTLKDNLPQIKTVSYITSAILAFLTVVFSQLRGTILISERKRLFPSGIPIADAPMGAINPMSEKWSKVSTHMESANPTEWRLAIIEADVMLSELLDKLNLPGDTIGDKMKAVERSDFTTLDKAWEAHKVRNQIAHEGSQFLLNERQARHTIDLYRAVFEEFYMI